MAPQIKRFELDIANAQLFCCRILRWLMLCQPLKYTQEWNKNKQKKDAIRRRL
jgi:hypothetical protein